jgi:Protein of unknown function (DUF4235)
MKFVFTPLSIGLALVAGQLSKKLFDVVWSAFDDEEAPRPKHRDVPLAKTAIALVVEGAIFRLVRGLTDHGARHAFAGVTGTWPGDERPDPE